MIESLHAAACCTTTLCVLTRPQSPVFQPASKCRLLVGPWPVLLGLAMQMLWQMPLHLPLAEPFWMVCSCQSITFVSSVAWHGQINVTAYKAQPLSMQTWLADCIHAKLAMPCCAHQHRQAWHTLCCDCNSINGAGELAVRARHVAGLRCIAPAMESAVRYHETVCGEGHAISRCSAHQLRYVCILIL